MTFLFSCSTWHLTRSLCSLVSYRVKHSKRNFILTRARVFSIYTPSLGENFQNPLNDSQINKVYLTLFFSVVSSDFAWLRDGELPILHWCPSKDEGKIRGLELPGLSGPKASRTLPNCFCPQITIVSIQNEATTDSFGFPWLILFLWTYQKSIKLEELPFRKKTTGKNWRHVFWWELERREVPQGCVLGPIFLNVHINDLLYHIKLVNLNAYANDQRLYSSDKDLETLKTGLEHALEIAWHHHFKSSTRTYIKESCTTCPIFQFSRIAAQQLWESFTTLQQRYPQRH